ncbi:hypothetical protein CspeluHIS016_0505660 [Cutaneotrichosporon spelunceum]|uniref:PUA domain-containing protein n=1 Tax=Cutaneotrichosporon spelunceum TaxID=1672016 RepID=A0AAD3TXX9_9TREE|nr:hypothetical protein CspeluHIS016_0505660 [Cutaneotrichosporon spelunceum]
MFKKFSVKEDVSGSTSVKSSVQRNVRNNLLEQLPLLSQPAYKEGGVEAPPAEPTPAPEATKEEEEEEEQKGKGKGGKGKGGKKGGKGGKKGKNQDAPTPAVGDDAKEIQVIDELWPKGDPLGLTKCHERINIYTVNSVPIFFNHFDGPFIPTLRVLHRYPTLLPQVQIDRGAIKFLLAGANMMAPGLLSKGGVLPDGLAKDAIVAIHAEGKEHACGIGRMSASSDEIRKSGKGVAIEVVCWVGDDFWKIKEIGL